jgi:hypothetical protein
VLDTYFVFLRTCVLLGKITLAREKQLISQTRQWLIERQETMPIYAAYLENWGDWENPWESGGQDQGELAKGGDAANRN